MNYKANTILILNNYNNYFNRKVRRHNTAQEYIDIAADYYQQDGVNFNPYDDVTTTLIVGSSKNPFDKDWNGDYLLVLEPTTHIIISRWYIIDFERNLGGQYKIYLKRDSWADKYVPGLNATAFIEKAKLKESDPFIVNSEGMSLNQIKKKEYYLKDETKVPWVIVYLARKREGTDQKDGKPGFLVKAKYYGNIVSRIEDVPELQHLFEELGDTHQKTYQCAQGGFLNFSFCGWAHIGLTFFRSKKITFNVSSGTINFYGDAISEFDVFEKYGFRNGFLFNRAVHDYYYFGEDEIRTFGNNIINNIKSRFEQFILPLKSEMHLYPEDALPINDEFIKKWNGKIVSKGEGANIKYYRIRFDKQDVGEKISRTNAMYDFYKQVFYQFKTGDWELLETQDKNNMIESVINQIDRTYQFSEVLADDIEMFIPNDTFQTQQCTYDILALPLFDTDIKNGENIYTHCYGNAMLNIASAIKTRLGDFCYDVQILPYTPLRSLIKGNYIDIQNAHQYSVIDVVSSSQQEKVGVGIIADYAHFTFDVSVLGTSLLSDDVVPMSTTLQLTNRKVQSNCEFYRLCSPNFASQFEFNIAKCVPLNRPYLSKFNVDCSYRPYNPYVHINPDYAFLYGFDFNDSRGLILSGDFGITTLDDKWVNYQIQNKNYQNMFDRQLQNMEVNRNIQREKETFDIIGAALGGAGGGALGGSKVGGVPGAIVGGLGGLGLGLGGALKDRELNEQAYKEQRSFSIDMFNMQLQNIQALPQSLTHTSALSYNFKFYPVLEFYSCTDEEKVAFEHKIKYNGMTVGRIDKVINYLHNEESFVKGQLIRIEGLNEDSHMANDMYEELNKGLFFIPYEETIPPKKKEN